MSDILRQTDSQQTAGTPNHRAPARDERAAAQAASGPGQETAPGPAPETASGTGASPMERPDGRDRMPGDVIYGSGDMEETDEEDVDMPDAGVERADMEAADPAETDLDAAGGEPAADMELSPEMQPGGAYPGPGMDTAAGTQPAADMATAEGMQADMKPGMGSGMGAAGGRHAQPGAEAVADTAIMADAAQVHERWQQIQATFVDDPRGSVERAATLADEVLNNVVTAGQQRITDLRNAWDGNETDTERLRNALRRYRMFIDRLASI